jgi:regulator of protease activity HflC (stomatin/prohibitin superfamily)
VQLAEQERQATVIRAEGEAEAAQLISKALAVFNNYLEAGRISLIKERFFNEDKMLVSLVRP